MNLTLPLQTQDALDGWLAVRGVQPGPLITALDRVSRGKRLSGMGLYLVVRQIGERAGIQVRSHGLWHAAITRALDLTGGDIRSVQRFSRRKDVQLLQCYDDNRQALGGRRGPPPRRGRLNGQVAETALLESDSAPFDWHAAVD